MLVKPWGVVLLALLGALGLTSLLVGVVLSWRASNHSQAALTLAQQLRVAIDSISGLGCRVR